MRSCAEPPRNTTWVAPSSSAARSTPDGSGRGWNARLARTTYSACASIGMPKQPCRNSCRKMSVPIRSRCSTSRTTRSRFSRRRIGTRRLPPANYAWTSFRFTAKYCSGHSLIAATVAETYNELLRCRRLPGFERRSLRRLHSERLRACRIRAVPMASATRPAPANWLRSFKTGNCMATKRQNAVKSAQCTQVYRSKNDPGQGHGFHERCATRRKSGRL